MRIPESFAIAEKEGMKFTLGRQISRGAHPQFRGSHVKRKKRAGEEGPGLFPRRRPDHDQRAGRIELNCTCEMPTIVVNHVDQPGRVAEVTTMLSMLSINIATMSVYRDRRGGRAVMVVELDQEIDGSVLNILQSLKGI